MNDENKYSAEDVAKILNNEGCQDISKRTVNYYAFDKNMFRLSESGKKCFTDMEIDKIRGIRLLKEHTNLTLEQIRKIICEHSLEEIRNMCIERTLNIGAYYHGNSIKNNSAAATVNSVFSSASSCNSTHRADSTSTSCSVNDSFNSLPSKEDINGINQVRTIKINDDITLILNNNIDTNRLKTMIDFLKEF